MNDANHAPQELTIKVLFFGVLLSMILSAANAYLGLFAGMTVSAAIPAAVIALGIMRFFRGSSIQECNLIGTCASAGESLAAGVIFTLPALLLLGFWDQFDYFWVALIAGFGGLLGVLFTIPLRRSLIIEQKLQFPEGVATAKVLETGRTDASGVWYIVKAAVAGGLFKIGANAIGFWPEIMQGAARVRGSIAYFGSNLSPALLSVGYIVGLNIAILIFIGGAANWLVTIPIVAAQDEWPVYQLESEVQNPDAWNVFALAYESVDPNASGTDLEAVRKRNAATETRLGTPVGALEYAGRIWSQRTRYIGVGGMLIGGLWTIFRMRKSLVSGVASGLKAYRQIRDGQTEIERTEKDLPMHWILFLIIGSVVPLFLVYQHFVQQIPISLVMALVMLLTGFLFAAVAGYMAGLVGSSNNPISGVTISTVLVSALLLCLLMGILDIGGPQGTGFWEWCKAVFTAGMRVGAEKGPAAAVIIGAVVCCAAAIAGDVMQDLKCGRLVGTTPWKQQLMEMLGTGAAALIIGPVLILLQNAYGFAGMEGVGPKALSSPQANLMASVAKGVFQGGLPWVYFGIGMGVAVLIIALDAYLQARNCSFRTPVLAVAIGFYLPFQLSVPIFIGGLVSLAVKSYHKSHKTEAQEVEASDRRGLLMASGLITGEALMGILVAIPIVVLKQFDIELPIIEHFTGRVMPFGGLVGVVLLAAVTFWLYLTTVRKRQS
ncbi:MAG: oligopeptide transporter, OPT family [Sedimentisphaerales bacterium]|nr:oligopeptide transporter, OPT family [Sedimentisphaerales bacterium]